MAAGASDKEAEALRGQLRSMQGAALELRDAGRHGLIPRGERDEAVGVGRVQAVVGFRPVGVMRRYERGPDGTWHDGMLMDLLADELT